MERLFLPFKLNKLLNSLFLANVFVSYHYALVIYLNSSFLSKNFNDEQISYLYIFGSIINVIALLNASKLLEKIGNYRFTIYSILLEFLAIFGLFVSHTEFLTGLYFIIHLTSISLLLFGLDVYVESVASDDTTTGSVRGTYLTITNIMIVLAPLSISFLVKDSNYSIVYILSALLMVPLYFSIRPFQNTESIKIQHIKIKETISKYLENSDLFNTFISHTLLQLFYGFMVIYTPIYLHKYIGFSWADLGIIFTIMLLPFVIFEIPVGEMEDDKYSEKEFLSFGFLITGFFTLIISFITSKNFWLWAILLFITRIGASLIEVSVESYFFKKVKKEETDMVGVFRMSRPLALIIAPIMASIFLGFIPFQYIFIAIGTTMIIGVRYAQALTKIK